MSTLTCWRRSAHYAQFITVYPVKHAKKTTLGHLALALSYPTLALGLGPLATWEGLWWISYRKRSHIPRTRTSKKHHVFIPIRKDTAYFCSFLSLSLFFSVPLPLSFGNLKEWIQPKRPAQPSLLSSIERANSLPVPQNAPALEQAELQCLGLRRNAAESEVVCHQCAKWMNFCGLPICSIRHITEQNVAQTQLKNWIHQWDAKSIYAWRLGKSFRNHRPVELHWTMNTNSRFLFKVYWK